MDDVVLEVNPISNFFSLRRQLLELHQRLSFGERETPALKPLQWIVQDSPGNEPRQCQKNSNSLTIEWSLKTCMILIAEAKCKSLILCVYVCITSKGRVQKPQSRLFAVMGVPPPPLPPSRQAAGQKINGKKITAKGGTPSPPITASGLEFFHRKWRFLPKKHCFWANFQQIF